MGGVAATEVIVSMSLAVAVVIIVVVAVAAVEGYTKECSGYQYFSAGGKAVENSRLRAQTPYIPGGYAPSPLKSCSAPVCSGGGKS